MYDENFNFIAQYVLKDIGLEGIDVDYTGNVCGVFENGISRIKKIHVSDIVFRRKKRLDNHFYEKGISFSEKLKENILKSADFVVQDFKEIINAIRECSAKIEQYGYKIDVEEYDLSTIYQVVFKIEK